MSQKVQLIILLTQLLDLFLEAGTPYNLLQVLEKAFFFWVPGFRFHEGNLLNLTLQYQEPIISKINSFTLQ